MLTGNAQVQIANVQKHRFSNMNLILIPGRDREGLVSCSCGYDVINNR